MTKPIVAVDRKSGKRIALTRTQAGELFVGGLVGAMSLAAQLKMPKRVEAALADVFQDALAFAPAASLAAVYERLAKTGGSAFTATERRRLAELASTLARRKAKRKARP